MAMIYVFLMKILMKLVKLPQMLKILYEKTLKYYNDNIMYEQIN